MTSIQLLYSETKDLHEFCADYWSRNYDRFMNWQRHQLWAKLGKTVQVEQPKVAKVRITGKPCPTVNRKVGGETT